MKIKSTDALSIVMLMIAIELCFGDDLFDSEYLEWFSKYRASNLRKEYNASYRKEVWIDRHLSIQKHNERFKKGLETYTQAHNEYSDWTPREFAAKFFGEVQTVNKGKVSIYKKSSKKNPASVDWIKAGYVNRAKHQGNCGSCYAFASVGALEGQVKRYFNQLPKLSTQQITSCAGRGCNGGNAGIVFNYLNSAGGIVSESDYYYTSGSTNGDGGSCQTQSPVDSRLVMAKVLSTVNVCDPYTSQSESQLVDALANVGPLYVSIYASGEGFMSYSSGVYSCSSCSSSSNHAVIGVGYGTDSASGKDYFSIMNSWGSSWGMDGVGWIERNNNFMIGIGKKAYYPSIDTSYAPPSVIKPPVPQDIKTDSLIFKSKEDDVLLRMTGGSKLNLLYRGSRDGFSSNDFHSRCDTKTNTIVIVKPRGVDYVFGGYATKAWDSNQAWIRDENAYIFSLRRNGVSSLEKYDINSGYERYALKGGNRIILQFGLNLVIRDGSDSTSSNSMGGNCQVYKCPSDASNNDADVLLTGRNGGYIVAEIEVFQVTFSMN